MTTINEPLPTELCERCKSPKLHLEYSKEYKELNSDRYMIPCRCLACGHRQDQEMPF